MLFTVLFEGVKVEGGGIEGIEYVGGFGIVDFVDIDIVDGIDFNFKFGLHEVFLEELVAALRGVDHQQFEEVRQGVGGLLADEELPVEAINLLVEPVPTDVLGNYHRLHLALGNVQQLLRLLYLLLHLQHPHRQLLAFNEVLVGNDVVFRTILALGLIRRRLPAALRRTLM
jgi:hypothetical protein